MELRTNPFLDRGKWYWRDAEQLVNGPYESQREALVSLLRHCDPRTKWQRLWAAWLEFVHS